MRLSLHTLDRLARFALLPAGHYTLLSVHREATDCDIEMGYRAACLALDGHRWHLLHALLWGRAPERLRLARDQLLDPVRRAEYDAELALWQRIASTPPF